MQKYMDFLHAGPHRNESEAAKTGRSRWALLLMLACFVLSTVSMRAQFESASVLGYVHDNSGAAVAGATVTLTNVATNVSQTAKTDNEGKYSFNSVPIGNYVIATEAAGFEGSRTERFNVATNARQRVDINVKPGSVSTVVEVTSAAQLLETETSSRGQVVATREVENLPLNGRSYADLCFLLPAFASRSLKTRRPQAARDRST